MNNHEYLPEGMTYIRRDNGVHVVKFGSSDLDVVRAMTATEVWKKAAIALRLKESKRCTQ